MLVSSNICGALTIDSFLTLMLVYPVKGLKNKNKLNKNLGTSLHIDKFTSDILHRVYTVEKEGIYAL